MRKKELFDEKVPQTLKTMQEWFATVISSRLTPDHKLDLQGKGSLVLEEAKKYIVRSHTLEPYERIQIYSQCYWTRLYSTLYDIFPLVVRLFGYSDFNQLLAVPYLLKNPSTHWDLARLGSKFKNWILKNYKESDSPLVHSAAVIDDAYQTSFYAKEALAIDTSKLTQDEMAGLLEKRLRLQPHLKLLKLPFHMPIYREAFLKESVEYWLEHDFPKVQKDKAPYFFAIFRNLHGKMEYRELNACEYELLELIEKGFSIECACTELEKRGNEYVLIAEEKIAFWLQEWLLRKWLCIHNKKEQNGFSTSSII